MPYGPSSSRSARRCVLFWIELRRRADPKFDSQDLCFNYSLEHAMPQNWTAHWSLPTSEPEDRARATRDDRVGWIGNMTLLTRNLNSSLRDESFEVKVEGRNRMRGMKHYGSLKITTDDILAPFDAGDRVWDEAKIEARTAALEAEFLTTWGTPDRTPTG